ncbi:MAG TPA: hypothetical protein VIE63_11825 [Ramlibacter sp.]
MNHAVPANQQVTTATAAAAALLPAGIVVMPLRAFTATGAAPPPG